MREFHVNAKYLEEVTPALIEGFITRRILESGISPKTGNRYREILHVMFNYAIRTRNFVSPDRRHPNPAAAVQRRAEPPRTIRFLSAEEIVHQLLILEGTPTIRAMVAIYIYAGLRREEALWLTHEDVDLERRLIRVVAKRVRDEFWQPKTKRNRVVPASHALLAVLRAYLPPKASSWFFPAPHGGRWDPDNFSQDLRAINSEHGLSWSCLDFRHTFGSLLAQKGESLYKIAELMGNSPEICRRHYAALQPEKMHDVVELCCFSRKWSFPPCWVV
jgi:integrase